MDQPYVCLVLERSHSQLRSDRVLFGDARAFVAKR